MGFLSKIFKRENIPKKRSGVYITCPTDFLRYCSSGYTRLSEHPDIMAAVDYVANIIGVMPIHLLSDTKNGKVRIENELSRKVDISPSRYTVRKTFMSKIAADMLLYGNSFVLPHYNGQILTDLEPLPFSAVSLLPDISGYGYSIWYKDRVFSPDEMLHFVYRPNATECWRGNGIEIALRGLVDLIDQSRTTAKALAEAPTPSVIINYEGEAEKMTTSDGRNEIEEQFLKQIRSGKPWMIPAELIQVTQLKPLTLSDLAISDNIELSKKSICSLLGTPAFVLNAGTYSQDEYNSLIRSGVLSLARSIEQELTKKLLISPNWHFVFSSKGMYAYSRSETASVVSQMVDRAILTRNEARVELGYMPMDGLDELAILENYIPFAKIGEQKKLQGGEE